MKAIKDKIVLEKNREKVDELLMTSSPVYLIYVGNNINLATFEKLKGINPLAIISKAGGNRWTILRLNDSISLSNEREKAVFSGIVQIGVGLDSYNLRVINRFLRRGVIFSIVLIGLVICMIFGTYRMMRDAVCEKDMSSKNSEVSVLSEVERSLVSQIYRWMEAGDFFQAQMSLKELKAVNPKNREIELLKAELERRKQMHDEEGLRNNLELETLLSSADEKSKAGNLAEALTFYKRWLEIADKSGIRSGEYNVIKDNMMNMEQQLILEFGRWQEEVERHLSLDMAVDVVRRLSELRDAYQRSGFDVLNLEDGHVYISKIDNALDVIASAELAAAAIVEQLSGCQKALSQYQKISSKFRGYEGKFSSEISQAVSRCS